MCIGCTYAKLILCNTCMFGKSKAPKISPPHQWSSHNAHLIEVVHHFFLFIGRHECVVDFRMSYSLIKYKDKEYDLRNKPSIHNLSQDVANENSCL